MEKPVIVNGDFEQGGLGWSHLSIVEQEENGNHYMINNYNWEVQQDMALLPHTTYEVRAQTKKGTAEGPARIVFTFYDVNDNQLPQYYDIKHMHTGNDWEDVPQQFIVIPDKASISRIYLFSNDPKGYHCFDNIEITRLGDAGDRKGLQINKLQNELIINGDFELGLYGWTGIANSIQEEENNRFMRNGYNWEVFQRLTVVPGQKYILSASTRMGTTDKPSRLKIVFVNEDGERIPEFYNILNTHKTTDWETVTAVIKAPSNESRVSQARIYLLTDDPAGTGTSDFDNISFRPVNDEELELFNLQNNQHSQSIYGTQDQHLKYVVKQGDTVAGIAQQFSIEPQAIIDENHITDPNKLEVGQILFIPIAK